MPLLETELKWFSVKFRKGMKKAELVHSGIIKETDELCVRVLLFLLCLKAKDLEKIDVDFFRSSVSEYIDDETILDVLYYLQDKNILDYKYERTEIAEQKGANMDKIVNLIGNISTNISNMSGGEYKEPEAMEEQREFEKIYRVGSGHTNHVDLSAAVEEKEPEIPQIIENTHKEEDVKFEKIELSKEESFYHTDLEITTDNEINLDEINSEERNGKVTLGMVCDELENNVKFRDLYNEIQQKLKAIINPQELEILYNLYNSMESGLLLKIAEYCGENVESPKTVVRYFERTALNLSDGGIKTLEQYIKHLENAQKASEYEIKIKNIFGLGDKKLNSKERQYIRTWAIEYNFSDEMIIEGYTKALDKGKATIPYINAIYVGWHEKGFKSVDEVRSEFNNNSGKSVGVKRQVQSDFDSDQFFEKLVRKSMKF